MSILKQLNGVSEQAAIAAEEQGWDAESIVIHLLGFIVHTNQDQQLGEYFQVMAKEENEGLS